MTEQELIAGCINEDRKCQEELFRRYAGKMLAMCLRYTRHQMEAEDIVQEAFIKIFDRLEQYQSKGSFEGWIRRITVNIALKKTQRKSFQNELLGVEDYQDIHVDPKVYEKLNEEEMIALIRELPDGYRTIFNLYVIEGYSHKEIADLIGVQESTSRSQLVKARKMLQGLVMKKQTITV